MARDRADGYVFDVHAFLRETLGLQPESVGAYATLMASGWDLPEAGVFPGDDRTLSIMARVTPDEWARISPQVIHLFDTTSRPGAWVHQATVDAYHAQKVAFATKSAQGSAAANARWGNRNDAVGIPPACGPDTGVGVGLGEDQKKKHAQFELSGEPNGVDHRAQGAAERATPRRRQRVRKPPDRELPDAYVAEMAARFKLPGEVMGPLRERFMLEAPHRGYVNYRSAFMNWCRIEAESRKKRGDDFPTSRPVDGQRGLDPRGQEIVWFGGNWRSLEDARHYGWKPQ